MSKNIKDLISERNVTLVELAEKTGISRQTFYNIVNKNMQPSLLVLKKICAYFDVDFKEYL